MTDLKRMLYLETKKLCHLVALTKFFDQIEVDQVSDIILEWSQDKVEKAVWIKLEVAD